MRHNNSLKDFGTVADAEQFPNHWTIRFAPVCIRPYLRLARIDRPTGTWLLLWPGWWAIALSVSNPSSVEASLNYPDPVLLVAFALGALVMRGAGCTYNDIIDRRYDALVARTKNRPIPSGAVTVTQAIMYMILLCLVGAVILLSLNTFAIGIGFVSLALIAIYPFLKRVTYWPQAFLGLTFNWGALLGWAASTGDLNVIPMVLYLSGVFWTLGYDTIYAHQDKEDDAIIGVKSTALVLGSSSRKWILAFYICSISFLALAGFMAGTNWFFYLGVALATGHLIWQVTQVDFASSSSCLRIFRSNKWYGWIIFAAIVFGQVIPSH